jgi:succinate dehydrogenase (ubiquinone) membrane anchor subunit
MIAILQGTVNDPTSFPESSRTHGSHHWAFERLLSAALVPMTGAVFVVSGSQYPILDGLLAFSLIIHSHIGVGVLTDMIVSCAQHSCSSIKSSWITFMFASSLELDL